MLDKIRTNGARELIEALHASLSNNTGLGQALQQAHDEQVARSAGRPIEGGGAANERLLQRLADDPALLTRWPAGLPVVYSVEDPPEYFVKMPQEVIRSSVE
jgi:hypothetical protein